MRAARPASQTLRHLVRNSNGKRRLSTNRGSRLKRKNLARNEKSRESDAAYMWSDRFPPLQPDTATNVLYVRACTISESRAHKHSKCKIDKWSEQIKNHPIVVYYTPMCVCVRAYVCVESVPLRGVTKPIRSGAASVRLDPGSSEKHATGNGSIITRWNTFRDGFPHKRRTFRFRQPIGSVPSSTIVGRRTRE